MPSEATEAVRNFRDAQEPRRRYWQAWMIDFEGIGSAKVTDEPGKVYVRLDRGLSGEASGEIVKAYARIRPIAGWAVWVGTTPYRDWEYTVLDVDLDAMGGAIDGEPVIEPHHITHEWGAPSGSDDTVFSKFIQLYDFSVWPYSGLTVEIKGGQFDPSGTTQTLNQTLVDLSTYQPTYGCLYALLCISPTGTIEVVPGQPVGGFLTLEDIPPAPSNDHWEIAAVRLCAGVDTIIQTPRDTNITDLRFANLGWAGKRYGGHNPVTLDANAQDLMTLTDQDIGLQNQPSGTVYAAPTGGNGIPDFRFLYDSDIPDIHTHYPGSIPDSALANPGGAATFLDLSDTPAAYAGEADKAPIVNAGEDALEFEAVLLADGTITGATGQAQDFGSNGIKADQIEESTADEGVYFPDRMQIGDVNDASLGGSFIHHVQEDASANFAQTVYSDDAGEYAQVMGRKARGSYASPTATQADDKILTIGARGYGATDWPVTHKAAIRMIAAENWTDSDQGAYMVFETTPIGSTSRDEVMRLDDAGKMGINTETIPHGGVGWAMLALDGANGNVDGPHIQITTATNNYPLLQVLAYQHDTIAIAFDAYYDGAWKSSDAGSSFRIYKQGDELAFDYDTAAAGGAITWNPGLLLTGYGKVGIDTATVPHGGVGWAMLALDGPAGDEHGPHIQITTDQDDYPVLQVLALNHDEVFIFFDSFYDGGNVSSVNSANFLLAKDTTDLIFAADSGVAAGGAITWVESLVIAGSGLVTVSTQLGIGTYTVPHGGRGDAIMAIEGTDSNASGPHVQFTTDSDDYPLMQIRAWAHDTVAIGFDAFYDGGWESADVGSNFSISKFGDKLSMLYDSGVAQGSAITWNYGIVLHNNGKVGINTSTTPHGGVGYAMLALDGANSSASGPHVQFTTASDNYPLIQLLPYTHDSQSIAFDAYFDGTWRSSDAGSNFRIYKQADVFKIQYESGIAQGAAITWGNGFAMTTAGIVQFARGIRNRYNTTNVSNPPTDAEIDAIFGTPATVGAGFTSIINDAGAGTAGWIVVAFGSTWWYVQLTKAV